MKRFALIICIAVVLVAVALPAQTPAPKPGPEIQRLGYFVGTWKMEGEGKDSPVSKAGKRSSTEVVTWFEGGFFTVNNISSQGPLGPSKSLIIKTWNPDIKAYQAYAISSAGTLGQAPVMIIRQVSVSGKTWMSTWDTTVGGKLYHIRMTQVEVSPTSYTEKNEYSVDNKTWIAYVENKYVKQ
jgi:hypothetical protein